MFVAVGISSMHAALWTSPDGLVWSRIPDAHMFREPASSYGWALEANGVAVHDGKIVVVGQAYGQDTCPPGRAARLCPGMRAWWSTDGRTWTKATVDKAIDAQMYGVAATPTGFLATGWGTSGCLSGIWASSDGHAWRCNASGAEFKGFEATAAAASDTVEVTVGLEHYETTNSRLSGEVWYRTLR